MSEDQLPEKDDLHNSIRAMADAMEKIAGKFADEKKNEMLFWKSFWKRKEFWSAAVIVVGLFGYWVNWREQINATKAGIIQMEIENTQKYYQRMNKDIAELRAILQRQVNECPLSDVAKKRKFKAERTEKWLNLSAGVIGINISMDRKINTDIAKIIAVVNPIDDICEINGKEIDDYLRSTSHSLNMKFYKYTDNLQHHINDTESLF